MPAITASSELALTAISTTREDSAQAARTRFGAQLAFTDARRLATHPDVDLVVVTVKVPATSSWSPPRSRLANTCTANGH
ncbi:hypothetical protein [Amycolatopsis sp. QT-25]|uniref:hypothetical protein n=1 Tax=Amycolatopsis sp. QT-25 TaxID=3034022 RepID=UPI00320A1070